MDNDFAAQLQEELLMLHLIETVFLDDLDAYDMWLDLYRPIEED
jgi:hypothetical protein